MQLAKASASGPGVGAGCLTKNRSTVKGLTCATNAYMATLTAVLHNPPFTASYVELVAGSKRKKVAAMRKLPSGSAITKHGSARILRSIALDDQDGC